MAFEVCTFCPLVMTTLSEKSNQPEENKSKVVGDDDEVSSDGEYPEGNVPVFQ